MVIFHDLKWPWRHDEGSPVTIFRLRVSSLPVNRCQCFEWLSSNKRRLSFFFHWLRYNGEVTKFIFHRYWYGYQSLKVSRQTFSRSSFDEHSNFLWGEVTYVTWWPDLAWPGSRIFTPYAEKMYYKLCQKRSGNLEKTEGGGALKSPPSGRRLSTGLQFRISTDSAIFNSAMSLHTWRIEIEGATSSTFRLRGTAWSALRKACSLFCFFASRRCSLTRAPPEGAESAPSWFSKNNSKTAADID